MKKYIFFVFFVLAFVMCHTPNLETVTNTNTPKFGSAEGFFKQNCASCHGADANVFADRQWKHGSTKAELVKSMTEGYPDLGMPAWGIRLKPEEINSLADYIAGGIEKRKSFDFKALPKSNIFKESGITIQLDTIASGIKNPWGMASLPDGDMLLTDRGGDFYRIDAKTRAKTLIKGTPLVLSKGQGGLLDVELHPKFKDNQLIYLSYSKFRDSAGGKWSTTAIMQAKLNGTQLSEQKDIFVAQPYIKTRFHYGNRIEFDKNGYMFISVGDRGQHEPNFPQLLDNDCGKIHRLFDDGRIPPDNPFVNTPNAHGSIWSYGHRNPQGISMNPATDELWTDEHGPRGGDEVNIAQKGKNYGWPVISYGINYDGTILTPFTKQEKMEQPLVYWVPSIGPCGSTFVTSDRYKGWKGNFMVASLRFMYLNRCTIEGNKIVAQENILKNIGRMRFVEMGADGYLYVGVEEPGFVFRLVSVENQ
ncbi:MAG: PQQ-dependent sugar dehydrogenase [Saprospiraceae bacterium]|nr:PQQ-dependent sugar dehydrogenase [Saprospiraceae bacterium]